MQTLLNGDSAPAQQGAAGFDFPLGLADFTYGDLYRPEGLRALAEAFYAELARADVGLHDSLRAYLNARGANLAGTRQESELLIAVAPHLSRFIARLFRIEDERATHADAITAQDPVFQFKFFVARRALKKFPPEQALKLDAGALDAMLITLRRAASTDTLAVDDELGIARMTVSLLAWEKQLDKRGAKKDEMATDDEVAAGIAREIARARSHVSADMAAQLASLVDESGAKKHVASAIDETAADEDVTFVRAALRLVEAWAAAHATQVAARGRVRGWVSFRFPHTLDYQHLVQIERPDTALPELLRGLDANLRRRDGFALTDPRATPREALDEVHYCLYCHERDKDSCSKGLREGASNSSSLKRNPLGILLEGCPLDEKISEMHVLQKAGDSIAALALVVIDNPMCPGTGHRICNDCMKSCIFQKQEPVNIPQAETGVLTDVLQLPYGFEIYSLLTRWNPLNAKRPFALPYNGQQHPRRRPRPRRLHARALSVE